MRYLAGISLALLIGLLLGASTLAYACYVLLVVFWTSRYFAKRWTESLKATRIISQREVEIGETVAIQIKLENRDRWTIPWVLIDDALPKSAMFGPPPALELSNSNLRMCSVPAEQARLVAYKLKTLRRGYFQIGPTIAETGDLLGLHRRFRTLTAPDYLLVLPKLIPLAGYDVASKRPVGEVTVTYRLFEDPTLVSGIREYQNGDPMRSIHWRASARTGQLQCKQYQPTSVAGATVVLDLHKRSNPDHHEPIRSDLAVTAAASICHTLLQMQQQFGLVTNGRDAADRFAETNKSTEFSSRDEAARSVAMRTLSDRMRPIILPPSRGPEHFVHIHKTLARLERTDGLALPDLLVEAQSRMPRDATVLVIVQDVDMESAMALGMLRRQGYSVSAIVNNYENEAMTAAVGRLMAQHIAVYHLLDEESIPRICKELVLRY
jgi:uncharacterized protein (DUF58 family)